MVVSFVNASLLTLAEAIGVILGAHIGTTVTAWLITLLGFKVSMSSIALPLVGGGFLLTFSKKEGRKNWGYFIIGFAILFIGLQFLKDAVPNIKENPEMLEFLTSYVHMGFWSVLLFLVIGTVLTLIVQSSSATMAITLIMCNEGWIPFDMAAAMVLGENIGTTITANLAAIVANYNAKRAARAHFISQTIGVLLMLIILYPFLRFIDSFTQSGNVSAFDSPGAIPVALSMFHTAFNVFNTVVLIWFIPLIVKIVSRMVPYVEPPEPSVDMPKYLNDNAMKYPQTAIRAMIDESRRLFEGPTFKIVSHALNLHRTDIKSDEKLKKIVKSSKEEIELDIDELYYSNVKTIYSKIIKYGTLIQSKFKLGTDKVEAINNLKLANRYMVEAIKDCRGLQSNVTNYMVSDNEYMENEYNQLRKKMSKVLREIYLTAEDKNPKKHLKTLETLKEKAKKSDVMVDGTLDKLIRKELISSEMATSLANDSDNVASISKHLIEVAELLYIQSDTLLENLPKLKKKQLKNLEE
jgi:phosphate:Na+ symporter